MLRTESSSAISQGYSDFYSLLSAITFLGLGLGSQIKTGPGPPINRPHNNLDKTFIIDALIFFCHKFKSQKLNNFILCVSIVSTSSSQKYYVPSLKDANNIDLMGKVT